MPITPTQRGFGTARQQPRPADATSASPGSRLPPNLPPPSMGSPNDPFVPDGIIRSGPLAGKKINTDWLRSAKILTPEEAQRYPHEPGETLVANFRHDERWWIARVPPGAVKEVIF